MTLVAPEPVRWYPSRDLKKAVYFYAFFIAYFTLYPWQVASPGESLLQGLRPLAGPRAYVDAVGNIFFYLPLGVLGVLTWRRRDDLWRRVIAVTASGAALALILEAAQAWIPGRDSSVQDLLLNTFGTMVGAGLALTINRDRGSAATSSLVAPRWSTPVVLALAWLVAQWFPFLPVLRVPALRYSLAHAIHLPSGLWLDLADTVIGCLVLSRLLRAVVSRSTWPFALLAAGLVLPLRLFLMAGSVSWVLTLGAAAALLVSRFVVTGSRQETRVLASLAVLVIAARVLGTANTWGTPEPFPLPPFSGLPGAARDAVVRNYAWMFFLYGGTLWMLREVFVRPAQETPRPSTRGAR